MKFDFLKEEVVLLNLIVRRPDQLPLHEVGLKQWSVDDRDVVVYRRLKRWLEEKVFKTTDKDKEGKATKYDFEECKGVELKTVYAEYLVKMFDHYKPLGRQTTLVDSYFPLYWKLKGESDTTDNDAADVEKHAPKGEDEKADEPAK